MNTKKLFDQFDPTNQEESSKNGKVYFLFVDRTQT